MGKFQFQVTVAKPTANDPLVAVRKRALFPTTVALAIAATSVDRTAVILFAFRTASVTNTKSFAFLLVGASLVLT